MWLPHQPIFYRINFNQYKIRDPNGVAQESEVLKYLRETEAGQTKPFGNGSLPRNASRPQSRNFMSKYRFPLRNRLSGLFHPPTFPIPPN